ncbi:MAG: S8 family serine peptidase, partial [Planctomycetota bacterium]
MKKHLPTLLVAFLLLCLAEIGFAGLAVRPVRLSAAGRPRWVPNEIVVKFKEGVSKNRIDRINKRHGTSVLY